MNKISLMFAVVSVVGTFSLQARIGESGEECEARYGKGRELPLEFSAGLEVPEGSKWVAKSYSTRGLSIQVVFDNDTAVLVRYANEPLFKLADLAPPSISLTAAEISYLRDVSLDEGENWRDYRDVFLSKTVPTLTLWQSSDEKLRAGYDRSRKTLFVCTRGFWNVVVGKLKDSSSSDGASSRLEGL